MDSIVTVAIASYNNASYIERCVLSVINQSYINLDIVIVDDGSKDDTQLRIKKYLLDNRIRFVTKDNGGLSSVRQMGLDLAFGDYICFIDSDDYIAPSYIQTMLSKMQKDKSDICVCSTRFEDIDGNYLPKETSLLSCRDSVNPIVVSLFDVG